MRHYVEKFSTVGEMRCLIKSMNIRALTPWTPSSHGSCANRIAEGRAQIWQLQREPSVLVLLSCLIFGPIFVLLASSQSSAQISEASIGFFDNEVSISEYFHPSDIDFEAVGDLSETIWIETRIIGGTAVLGADYRFFSRPIGLSLGQPGKKIPQLRRFSLDLFDWISDGEADSDKTIVMEISSVESSNSKHRVRIGKNRRITITIVDDDGGHAIPGRRDRVFGDSGYPTSKVYVGPDQRRWAVSTWPPCVYSFTEDGEIDRLFKSRVFENRNEVENIEITLLPLSGKVLAAGNFSHYGNEEVGNLIMINQNGMLDEQFSSRYESGVSISSLETDSAGRFYALGKFERLGGALRNQLARFLPSGDLDESYRSEQSGPNTDGVLNDIAILDDDHQLIAGRFINFDDKRNTGVVRLDSEGHLVEDFVFDRELQTIESALTELKGVAALSDRGIYVYGPRPHGGFGGIAKLLEDGSFDSGFLQGAPLQVDTPILFTDDHLYVGSSRYSLNEGILDRTFVAGAAHNYGNGSMAIDPGGYILYPGEHDLWINRVSISPLEDPTFVSFRQAEYHVSETQDSVRLLVHRSDTREWSSVRVRTVDGSAIAGVDYTPIDELLDFWPYGDKEFVEIPIHSDQVSEGRESFTVELVDPVNSSTGSIGTATVAICDHSLAQQAIVIDNSYQSPVLPSRRLSHPVSAHTFDELPDGRIVAIGDFVRKDEVGNEIGGGELHVFARSGAIEAIIPIELSSNSVVRAVSENNALITYDNQVKLINVDSRSIKDFVTFEGIVNALTVLENGDVLVYGSTIKRYNFDGTEDKGFQFNGNLGEQGIAVATETESGHIVIGGGFLSIDGFVKRGLARLNPDGSVDSTFHFVGQAGPLPLGGRILGDDNGRVIPTYNFKRVLSDGRSDPSFDADWLSLGDLIKLGDGRFMAFDLDNLDSQTSRVALLGRNGLIQQGFCSPFEKTFPTQSASLRPVGSNVEKGYIILHKREPWTPENRTSIESFIRVFLPSSLPTIYEEWRSSKGSEIPLDEETEFSRDSDNDSCSNILEFVLGTDILDFGDTPATNVILIKREQEIVVSTKVRSEALSKFVAAEISNDLITWRAFGGTRIINENVLSIVSELSPEDRGNVFLRFSVSFATLPN